MDLWCPEETVDNFDDLGLDGLKSYEDPQLMKDSRVLKNLMAPPDGDEKYDYFKLIQSEIKPHMRKIVSDWILEVTEEQQCQPEVFALAVNYMDRFLSRVDIRKSQFQLVACVCIFVASKFKESNPICADKLAVYTDFSVRTDEITQWEIFVLNILGWDLSATTPYAILDQLLRRLTFDSSFNLSTIRRHAETFLALTATEFDFYPRSATVLAVSCLTAAFSGMKRSPQQCQSVHDLVLTLASVSGIPTSEILSCVSDIESTMQLRMPPSNPQNNNYHQIPTTKSPTSSAIVSCSDNPPSSTPTDVMDVSQCRVY